MCMTQQRSEIAHIDLDAYFVAVEQRDDPSLIGRPVIVGGSLENRSVVTSCSYEVREKGVHAGMALKQARALCPSAVFKIARLDEYRRTSREVMDFFHRYAPIVEQMSIDEAFLDFRHTRYIYDNLPALLMTMQKELMTQYGLSCSIGLASSHYFAKIASDHKKPHGFVHIEPQQEAAFIASIPLEKIWGLGKKSLERLQFFQITSIETLKKTPLQNLRAILGKSHANYLTKILNGEDPQSFMKKPREQSMSCEETFPRDLATWDEIKAGLLDIAQKLAARLDFYHYIASVVVLKVRFKDFSTFTTQKKIEPEKLYTHRIYDYGVQLFKDRWSQITPIRLLGIGVKKLQSEAQLLEDFFEHPHAITQQKLDKTVFSIKNRYGDTLLQPARTLYLYGDPNPHDDSQS